MISPPIKIGVTGTHSTGKTSFLDALERELVQINLRVRRLGNFASDAQKMGFPILRDHNYDSTLWIMTQCMRLEAEAALSTDVILVDRPVIDALGYLRAALHLTHRSIGDRRLDELTAIVRVHTPEYDRLIKTSLDKDIDLGVGRDQDEEFRETAASWIDRLVSDNAPDALTLTSSNQDTIVQDVVRYVSSRPADIDTDG
ncbi:AAA family ATPase [Bradyrhizobium mercantei]|uniref:AAA family ATPase n=1 Tax=Bradyrhizobium mercantei TaxID=1904807 RepID=UPI0009F8788F|nr:AAA family ATPase [Bradyrhizobium mercantei]